MGNQMPTVADFLKIGPLTAELVREIGYLPQCSWEQGPKSCGRQTEWTVEADHYCALHKDEIVRRWEEMIADFVRRPPEAQDSDLKLLEMIRDELDPRDLYPGVNVGRVVKDLSLPETPEGRSLAAWYLWEMGIFSIHQRTMFYEQS